MGKAFRVAHPSDIKTVVFDSLKRERVQRNWSVDRLCKHFRWKYTTEYDQKVDRATIHSVTIERICTYAHVEFVVRNSHKTVLKTGSYLALCDYLRRQGKLYRLGQNLSQKGMADLVGAKYPAFEREISDSLTVAINIVEALGHELYMYFKGLNEDVVSADDQEIELVKELKMEAVEVIEPPVKLTSDHPPIKPVRYLKQVGSIGNGKVVNGFTGW